MVLLKNNACVGKDITGRSGFLYTFSLTKVQSIPHKNCWPSASPNRYNSYIHWPGRLMATTQAGEKYTKRATIHNMTRFLLRGVMKKIEYVFMCIFFDLLESKLICYRSKISVRKPHTKLYLSKSLRFQVILLTCLRMYRSTDSNFYKDFAQKLIRICNFGDKTVYQMWSA